jgi:protein XagA
MKIQSTTGANSQGRRIGSASLAMAGALLTMPLAMPVAAGAWVAEQGKTLSILKLSHTNDAAAFDGSSDRTRFPDRGTSRQDQLNLYIEHGLTEDLTLIGNFYYNRVRYDSDTFDGRNSGFGDQELGVRYRLNPPGGGDPWVGAVQALVSIPTYDEDDTPALGLGGYDLELRYSVGRGFPIGTRTGYVDAGAALRWRTGDPADEFRFDISSGIALTDKWMIIGELNVIEGLGNSSGQRQMSFIDSTDYDLTKLQLSALYTLSHDVHFQLGYVEPIFGRNTGAAGGPFVAAWWRF